jgi:serine/threonine protein phosphatase PrpC
MDQMGDHYFGITDRGRVRDNNEDAFLVKEASAHGQILACVIDGVGGYEGGEVAAAIAKESIETRLSNSQTDIPAALTEAIYLANQQILEQKQTVQGKEKMACVLTLALADISKNTFYYAHVGDTRLYLLRGQSLVKVTRDHSFVGFLEDSSRITEMDAMRHPKRNEVNKALGFDATIGKQPDYVETGNSPFLPGDLLLLCSDGLTDMVGAKEITEILTSKAGIAEKGQRLIDAANTAGGKDNITVVLVYNNKEGLTHEPTLPTARKVDDPIAEPTAEAMNAGINVSRKGTSPIVWILLLLCAGLGAALAWQMTRKQPEVATTTPAIPTIICTSTPNAAEQRLADSLNNGTGSLMLDSSARSNPVMISDTLIIAKDSFHFSGNGIVLKKDSALHGPALFLPSSAKYVFLENIVFENFPIAIVADGTVLKLSNVRFLNCDIPVSYQLHPANGAYTRGLIHEGLLLKTDSLPYNKKAWQ